MNITNRKELENHRAIWYDRPLLQDAYKQWYGMVERMLANPGGKVIELGGGSGNYREWRGSVVSGDIVESPWLDFRCDAHLLPFKSGSIHDLVLIDVLHHLTSPVVFLEETKRVLSPHGRLHLVEPYPSPVSLPLYRRFHPEPFLFNTLNFANAEFPLSSVPNQALAYQFFFKFRGQFERYFGNSLRIIQRRRMATLMYPLSGGFEGRQLAPNWMRTILKYMELFFSPLTPFFAFRCYVVCEKMMD